MEQPMLNFMDERHIYSVSELVNGIRQELDARFHDLWVKGEISNLGRPPSGHLYFTLKDGESQIAVVFFRQHNRYLRFTAEDGMDVLVRGSVSVYSPRGQLQLIIEHMEPLGRGALQLAFEQLKERLSKEGLFDPKHKKSLPLLPARIGVVTSPTGAAIQDILRVLKRRNDRLNVLIYPTRVQGAEAAREIVQGIRHLNTRSDIDVMIVGRGGGSLEDLWAFNEEIVARAIFESRIPVISAVGHEIDFTIADFVADLRAPTPSAAAEIVSGRREELANAVSNLLQRKMHALRLILQTKRIQLDKLARSRAFVDAESRIKMFLQRLDELFVRLAKTLPYRLDPLKNRVDQSQREVERSIGLYIERRKQGVEARTKQLTAYSPLLVLERGYAIVSSEAGTIVRGPEQLGAGEKFSIRVARGAFTARKE